jgi:hypothetical protein
LKIVIPYSPHAKQQEIHSDPARFKVVAAGRRGGKTVNLVNEHIIQALNHPQMPDGAVPRSWYVCTTYRQAETIAWRMALQFLPPELIANKQVHKLTIELVNGHVMEFKGSEDYDKLRGVGLCWVGIDEYGLMKPEVWTEVLRPMLIQSRGGAMFIGTPGADGSPHFHELFLKGERREDDYKSWMFYTKDNPHIPPDEIEKARKEMPPDIFKREFEADFSCAAGLVYDNFKHQVHVIPRYEPPPGDFIVGSIDPGLHNPTAALLSAWSRDGVGRIFAEYYVEGRLAGENALEIAKMAKSLPQGCKVAYWVIDRSSTRRDPASGLTVYGKYRDAFKEVWGYSAPPIISAPNDPGSVWAGIDETKKLFEQKKMLIAVQCHKTIWELGRYIMYRRKHFVEKNEEEKPRKLHDHAMDCMRNIVLTRPWTRRGVGIIQPKGLGY